MYTAIICSGFAYFLQAYSQNYITPVRPGIVQSLLPIFSMFFARIILGNTLSIIGFVVLTLFTYNVDVQYLYSIIAKKITQNEVA